MCENLTPSQGATLKAMAGNEEKAKSTYQLEENLYRNG